MQERKRKKRVVPFLVLAAIMVGVVVYFNWYSHVVGGEDPYDETFITINQYMPQQAKDWACGTLAERFPDSLPPLSC